MVQSSNKTKSYAWKNKANYSDFFGLVNIFLEKAPIIIAKLPTFMSRVIVRVIRGRTKPWYEYYGTNDSKDLTALDRG